MNKTFFTVALMAATLSAVPAAKTIAQVAPIQSQTISGGALIGRWDLTIDKDGKAAPSWLEVELSGFETLVGRFVGIEGSARPISKVKVTGNRFSFAIPPQWEKTDKDLVLNGELKDGKLTGTIQTSTGETFSFNGVKAPLLVRKQKDIKWGKPVELFNGKNLEGWKAQGEQNQWLVKDGVLTSPKSGSNLLSERKFDDFKIYAEFRYQKGSNSGLFLRGRYETQIIDNPKTDHPNSHLFGGIYGFLVPSEMAVGEPGEWQNFEITLVGRMITVVANGKTIICDQEIPGITGGALDSNEGEPGPILIQGDHGPIEFKTIRITPAL